jgi:hypothetical protein
LAWDDAHDRYDAFAIQETLNGKNVVGQGQRPAIQARVLGAGRNSCREPVVQRQGGAGYRSWVWRGLATATAFAEAGVAVVLADVNQDAVCSRAEELASAGHKPMAVACNVAAEAEVAATERGYGLSDHCCRHRRGGGQRCHFHQISPIRDRFVLRFRQYVPQLPGGLSFVLHFNAEFICTAQAPLLRVPLADGTLVATSDVPSKDLVPDLLALSDVTGTGWSAAGAADVKPGKTVVVVGDGAVGLLRSIASGVCSFQELQARHGDNGQSAQARPHGACDTGQSEARR